MEIASVTILLQYECTRNTGSKVGNLGIFKPHVSIADQVLVGKMLEQLDLDEDFSQPFVVILVQISARIVA